VRLLITRRSSGFKLQVSTKSPAIEAEVVIEVNDKQMYLKSVKWMPKKLLQSTLSGAVVASLGSDR
jgi:hypothetical protein